MDKIKSINSKLTLKDNKIIFIYLKLNENIEEDKYIKKEIFHWGDIFIKFQEYNNFYLFKELYSKEIFNSNLEWNINYIDSIIKILTNEYNNLNKEYSIDLISNNNDYILQLENKLINIDIKFSLLKVNLEIFYSDPFEKYFSLTKNIIDNIEKDNTIENLEKDKQKLVNDLDLLRKKYEDEKEEMLDKFVMLLNEKKKKIKEIKGI